MTRFRSVSVLVVLLLLAFPAAAFACPACLDLTSENRMAFLHTAIALTLLPFGLVGGLGLWLRKKLRAEDDAEHRDSVEDAAPGPDQIDL